EKFGRVNVPASSKDKNFTYIPDVDAVGYSKNASYIHVMFRTAGQFPQPIDSQHPLPFLLVG
ncbi:hypothetical protein NE475_19805, partial [Ruthenibacterium lactatiformans]|nr:hypothetical protein [Ruthenibacterium lactatiformans]